jgi:hypothetical protein
LSVLLNLVTSSIELLQKLFDRPSVIREFRAYGWRPASGIIFLA